MDTHAHDDTKVAVSRKLKRMNFLMGGTAFEDSFAQADSLARGVCKNAIYLNFLPSAILVAGGRTVIHVKVSGLSLSNMGFVVLLRGEHDARTLPIFIGGAEAQSIAIRMDNVEIPRPLTHDLFKSVLDCVECRLKRVVINDLIDGTFYAVLVMEHDGVEAEVDARPSDAVALAIRTLAPIYVVQKVMDQAGILIEEASAPAGEKPHEGKHTRQVESVVKHLKSQLEQAISSERYEEAARLRDEIRKAEQEHRRN